MSRRQKTLPSAENSADGSSLPRPSRQILRNNFFLTKRRSIVHGKHRICRFGTVHPFTAYFGVQRQQIVQTRLLQVHHRLERHGDPAEVPMDIVVPPRVASKRHVAPHGFVFQNIKDQRDGNPGFRRQVQSVLHGARIIYLA